MTVYETSDEDALNRLEKMGLEFQHKDLQKGEWTDLDNRNKRKTRQKQTDDIDKKAASLVKKPKKVKPGYKKKMKWEMDKIKKRERRIKRK